MKILYQKTFEVTFFGGEAQTVSLSIKTASKKEHRDLYWISAVLPTGYDLCGPSNRIYVDVFRPNLKLRSEANKKREILDLAQRYEASIRRDAPGIVASVGVLG